MGIAPFLALNLLLTSDPDLPFGVLLGLMYFEAPWATAPLTLVMGRLMFGQRPVPGSLSVELLRALPAIFLYQVGLRSLLVMTWVLVPLIPTRLLFLNEVILLERVRWWRVPRRCFQITEGCGAELFGQWLAVLGSGAAFIACCWFGLALSSRD